MTFALKRMLIYRFFVSCDDVCFGDIDPATTTLGQRKKTPAREFQRIGYLFAGWISGQIDTRPDVSYLKMF